MDNDLTIKQARGAAAHPPGPRPPARAAGAVPRVILGDWLCWVLSGMWGGREWWDPPAAAARVRGEGSAEMRPGARKAAGGDGYPSRMNWGGWGALWGARGTIAGLFRGLRCRLTRTNRGKRRECDSVAKITAAHPNAGKKSHFPWFLYAVPSSHKRIEINA